MIVLLMKNSIDAKLRLMELLGLAAAVALRLQNLGYFVEHVDELLLVEFLELAGFQGVVVFGDLAFVFVVVEEIYVVGSVDPWWGWYPVSEAAVGHFGDVVLVFAAVGRVKEVFGLWMRYGKKVRTDMVDLYICTTSQSYLMNAREPHFSIVLQYMLPAEYTSFLYNVAGLCVKMLSPAQNVW